MFSGSGACSWSAWRFNHSLTMRCERSAMSPIERPTAVGSGSRNPGASVLVWSAIRVLSVGTTTSYTRVRPGADSTMLSSVGGGQPRSAGGRVQAGFDPDYGTCGLRFWSVPLLLVLLLQGCASFPGSMNPVNWWHDLQGGKIAEQRPPPPGADEPYPNLATVPPKPAPPDAATLANIASALIADRTNAQHIAAAAPIADPSLPAASPSLFGRGTIPPPPRPRHRPPPTRAPRCKRRRRHPRRRHRPLHLLPGRKALPQRPPRRPPGRLSVRCRAPRLRRPRRRRNRLPWRRRRRHPCRRRPRRRPTCPASLRRRHHRSPRLLRRLPPRPPRLHLHRLRRPPHPRPWPRRHPHHRRPVRRIP